MPYELTDKLVVGISSRTLFDLEKENQVFENEHLEVYIRFQLEHLAAFNIDFFLSKSKSDVQAAIDAGFTAALIYDPLEGFEPDSERIRIALDADAVLFAEESEQIYKEKGLEAFFEHERQHARRPLPEGPFAKFLKTISTLQRGIEPEKAPIRLAIVTARNSPAHERVIRTLREWGVRVDAAFFLGGTSKEAVLKAFRAHMFFDDQEVHLGLASTLVPAGLVPYRTGSPLRGSAETAKSNDRRTSTQIQDIA
jgi:5'-nucleotidase